MGERTKGHTVEQTIVYFHSKKFCFLLRFQTSWVRLTLNIRTDSSPSNNLLPSPGIDPRGTTLKNQLYTPSHMSNICLKCFSDQNFSIALVRFNKFVKFSKISELTITKILKKLIVPRGSIRISRVFKRGEACSRCCHYYNQTIIKLSH